uniref:Uncharacterized protein n=1 Tax=Sipha flava TaxID=143950 RepID=A0A2S2Q274_9HEMI
MIRGSNLLVVRTPLLGVPGNSVNIQRTVTASTITFIFLVRSVCSRLSSPYRDDTAFTLVRPKSNDIFSVHKTWPTGGAADRWSVISCVACDSCPYVTCNAIGARVRYDIVVVATTPRISAKIAENKIKLYSSVITMDRLYRSEKQECCA